METHPAAGVEGGDPAPHLLHTVSPSLSGRLEGRMWQGLVLNVYIWPEV